MREYILAVKAFFSCWQDGVPLDFQGQFFRHTLMTPMFNPGPLDCGPPPVLLGAMGPRMTEVAGEVADGLIVHPFNTVPFLRDEQLPALRRGQAAERANFVLQVAGICVTGTTEEEYRHAEQTVRGLLAFYGSTPAYLPPMRAIGYEALQPELNALSKEGRWDAMTALIDDDFLRAFAVCGEPHEIAPGLLARYGDVANRLSIYAPYSLPDNAWRGIVSELKTGQKDVHRDEQSNQPGS
jgi:probable F420-dependent oxidoreductase